MLRAQTSHDSVLDEQEKHERDASSASRLQACEQYLESMVLSSWKQLRGMLAEQQGSMRIVAQSVPQALADTQAQGLHAFRTEMAHEIEPIAVAVAGYSARPLVSAFLRPLCLAHRAAIVLWWDTLVYVLKHDALSSPQLGYFFRDTRWKRGVLFPAFQHVRSAQLQHRTEHSFALHRFAH